MYIMALVVGQLQANCYVVACDETKKAVVIDPGAEPGKIIAAINEKGYKLEYILNTHGHMDHIGANEQIKKNLGGKLGIHESDVSMLDVRFQTDQEHKSGDDHNEKYPDFFLNDSDRLDCGKLSIDVIQTPGHTPGGVCFKMGHHLFTGDTLFAGSVGRWDFPGGSYDDLMNSIQSKLAMLPDETEVYPGHGPKTTMGYEKRHNPFLNE